MRRKRAALADGTWMPFVDAGPARARIIALDAAGMSQRAMADGWGVDQHTVRDIREGKRSQIRPGTSDRILNGSLDPRLFPATAKIPAIGTVRRIQALRMAAFSTEDIAFRLGEKTCTVKRWGHWKTSIGAGIAARVADLYDLLENQQGESNVTAKRAAFAGYLPAVVWDPDTIDDPTAVPLPLPEALKVAKDGRKPVDLDTVLELLGYGETLEAVAVRLGIADASITEAARRRGTPAQKTRVARAAEEMKEIRLGMAS
jgi:hypothetical protein